MFSHPANFVCLELIDVEIKPLMCVPWPICSGIIITCKIISVLLRLPSSQVCCYRVYRSTAKP